MNRRVQLQQGMRKKSSWSNHEMAAEHLSEAAVGAREGGRAAEGRETGWGSMELCQ